LKVVTLSPACSPTLGSESLVGFRAVEALAEQYETTVITSAGMKPPDLAACEEVPIRFDDPNDISAWQLLRFELRQRRIVRRLLSSQRFAAVHRITPSGFKGSLLPAPPVPLVLGPILLSELCPPAFDAIFRPALPTSRSPRAVVRRVQHGIARRLLQRWSTFNELLENAALILAGTKTTLRRLPARLHARCRLVTYAGVEHDLFRPAPKQPNQAPQLLFVGRVVPYKGVELLLRAAAVAIRSCRFELTIVGRAEPDYRRYCAKLVDELGLMACARFIDAMPRRSLVDLYQRADVFCMPSVETYGLAILEAMSCGCAVLVSDINGPGEIVQPGTGLKVPLNTPEQFIDEYADRIVELVENPTTRGKLAAAARAHVVQHHDWKEVQARLLEVYETILPRSNAFQKETTQPIATASR
jgi:glycosyltransferase involved in cell wall biosynthesis